MLELLGLLGMVMAGVVGGSLAMRPDADEAPEDSDAAEPVPHPVETPDTPAAQLWDDPAEPAQPAPAAAQPDPQDDGVAEVRLNGGRGNDGLEGGDGRERLFGRAGDDQMNGAGGDDRLNGGEGDDTLHGGEGDDRMRGGVGADWMAGSAGADRLFGGAGNDTMIGGQGDDSLVADDGADWLAGGEGNDRLVAGPGQDTLDGDAGDDTLVGGGGHYLNGGSGADLLRIGAGDVATGGDGADSFEIAWPGGAAPATIMDFDPEQDALVVVWDGAGLPPQISLAPGSLPDDVVLQLDGQTVAHLRGGGATLTPGAIRLVADGAALSGHGGVS